MRRGSFCPMDLTYEYVNECLDYNVLTGAFTWKIRPRHHFPSRRAHSTWNARYAGTTPGYIRPDGYIGMTVGDQKCLAHRLAWFMVFGEWPTLYIDHINGVGNDNRLVNLREAHQYENTMNSRTPKCNTSGTKGVVWSKQKRKWTVQIRSKKRRYCGGFFDDIEEAKAANRSLRQQLHGEFSHHG